MFKRATIVALVVAAFVLMLAVPALAFNGERQDYTTTSACQVCHAGIAGIPSVYPAWVQTKHAVAGAGGQADRLPYGSVCGGCHVANYSPTKVVPVETAPDSGVWVAANGTATEAQTVGTAASSESFVGCSSCHYGAAVAGELADAGSDKNDTAHRSPIGLMANADICGQCHSRYSYTVAEIPVTAVPTNPTTVIQPQMAIGYPMLGSPAPSPSTGWNPAAPLSDYLNIPAPGWTPTPVAGSSVMTYWKDASGKDLPWTHDGHDGSAAQYPEWANEGHANALTALTSQPFWSSFPEATKQECLGCHSTDFRVMKDAGVSPTSADVRYGVTCVGCHTPHDKGTAKGEWDQAFDTQLITDSDKTLCTECHTSGITAGKQAKPGTEIHQPNKEMMAGYGAVGVTRMPSPHNKSCVQCHMPPTAAGTTHGPNLGGNHTFQIIAPDVAANVTPDSNGDVMPYSACSTCHGTASDPLATRRQNAMDTVQEFTTDQIAQLQSELDAAAVKLGYADADAAQAALVAIPESQWNVSQMAFLAAYTNTMYVNSDGSRGMHNPDYTYAILGKAQDQVTAVTAPTPKKWVVSMAASKKGGATVKRNTKVKYRGNVLTGLGFTGTGKIILQRKLKGKSWKTWVKVGLNPNGTYSRVLKQTKKGTWYVRAKMPGDGGLNLTSYSRYIKIKVK